MLTFSLNLVICLLCVFICERNLNTLFYLFLSFLFLFFFMLHTFGVKLWRRKTAQSSWCVLVLFFSVYLDQRRNPLFFMNLQMSFFNFLYFPALLSCCAAKFVVRTLSCSTVSTSLDEIFYEAVVAVINAADELQPELFLKFNGEIIGRWQSVVKVLCVFCASACFSSVTSSVTTSFSHILIAVHSKIQLSVFFFNNCDESFLKLRARLTKTYRDTGWLRHLRSDGCDVVLSDWG